jgi:hypothetical protein
MARVGLGAGCLRGKRLVLTRRAGQAGAYPVEVLAGQAISDHVGVGVGLTGDDKQAADQQSNGQRGEPEAPHIESTRKKCHGPPTVAVGPEPTEEPRVPGIRATLQRITGTG